MNTFLKWILAIAGVVVVLFIVAAVVLPMVIDPNNYKDQISAAVLRETGRELVIGGDIRLSVFPTIGLGLSDVRLAEPGGSGDEPMIDIGEAEVSVKLLPLLRNTVEIGRVDLNDVSVNLYETPGQDAITFSGVAITDANVSLDNADQSRVAETFGLDTSSVELGQAFDLSGSFSVYLAEPDMTGDVDFSGLIQPARNEKQFWVDGLNVSFKGRQGKDGESIALDMNLSTNADINLAQDRATLNNLVFTLYDLLLSGDFDVTSIRAEPAFSGQVKLAEFSPKSLFKDLGMQALNTTAPDALTSFQGEMALTGSSNSINMQDLSLKFDDSALTGYFKLDDFDLPRLSFDFQIDQLNLDDYAEPEGSSAGGQQGAETSDFSVDDFRGFAGGGDFSIGKLIISGLTATDVSTTMSSDRTGVRFHPFNADFYGGKHEGDIRVDALGEYPVLKAKLGLSGVQAGDLLKDLTGAARLLGKADFFMQVESDITNSSNAIQSLSGDMGMNIVDGSIVGIDISKTLSLVSSVLGKQKDVSGETSADQKTEFAEMSMSGVFSQGVLKSDDLIMQSTLLNATGEGSFNLVEESIDYVLSPVLADDTGVGTLDKLAGVAIPIRLTGNLYEPDYNVDVVAVVMASQKDLIDQKKSELIGKLLGGTKDKKDKKKDKD